MEMRYFPAGALAVILALVFPVLHAQEPPPGLSEQLVLAEKHSDWLAAVEITNRQLAERPDDLGLLTRLARYQHRAGDLERAAVTLQRLAVLAGKSSADVLEIRGDLAQAENRPSDALSDYQLALQAAPDSVRLLEKLARHYQDAGAFDSAAIYYQKLAALRKHSGDHLHLARAAVRRRDWNAMAHHLSLASEIAKANKLRPPSTSQYESLFSKAVQLGRYDLAIKSDPQDIATILARAQLFHAHGFYAEALEDARRAGRIDRRAPHVRYAMAYYYAAAGDSEKGTEFNVSTRKFRNRHRSGTIDQLANFDRRVRENPGDLSELRARAKFLLGQEQVSLAVEDIDRALAKEPNAIPTQLLKIDALQMSNETTAARKLIRQLAGAHDDNNDVLQKVGEVQMEDGFFEDAIVTFDKILARSPTYEAARNARALCYKRLQKQPPVAALPTATKPVSKP